MPGAPRTWEAATGPERTVKGGEGQRGGAGPAVLGEEMRLPEKRLSSDEQSPEGSLGQACGACSHDSSPAPPSVCSWGQDTTGTAPLSTFIN